MCSHNINQRAPCFHIPFIVSFFRSFSIIDKKNQPQHQRREKKKAKKIPLRGFSLRRYAVYPFIRVLLTTGYTLNTLLNMQILKDGAIADGGLYVLIYWQFLPQRRLSDSIEQCNEPARYRSHRNFAKSIFVVQIYQTDAQYGGSRITNLAERY